MANSHVQLS